MLFLAVVAFALATVRMAGGSYTALAELRLRVWPLVVLALALQVVLIVVLHDPPTGVAAVLHLASYAVAGGFLMINRHTRGMPAVAGGAALNVLAIALNNGTMPASAAALRAAGIDQAADRFANSAAISGARLPWLGDVFAVPERFGLLANVFSVGDVILCAGAVLLVHAGANCGWATGGVLEANQGRRVGAEQRGAAPAQEVPDEMPRRRLDTGHERASGRRDRLLPDLPRGVAGPR